MDAAGVIYVADTGNYCIRRITKEGIIGTIAGNGLNQFSGDGGPAIAASIVAPEMVAVDAAGNVYIGSYFDTRIRKISPNGLITTVAGTGTAGFSGDGGPAVSAKIQNPQALAVDGAGNLYISDTGNYRIRRVDAKGIITTIAGNGLDTSSDGVPAIALRETPALKASIVPLGVVLDRTGTLFFCDSSTHRVAQLTSTGTIVTVAGNGNQGISGDGGPALAASLSVPLNIALDPSGNLFIADLAVSGIRKVTSAGVIASLAGYGAAQFSGDNGPATLAAFNYPQSVALDGTGRMVIADSFNNRLRRVEKDGTVQTIAGTGDLPISADADEGVDARKAGLAAPAGVAFDKSGNLYVTELFLSRVRKITPDGIITTIAGQGPPKLFAGDGGTALKASLNDPTSIEVDPAGNVYIADSGNNRIRRIDPNGVITTFAGGGNALGDGGPAVRANLKLSEEPHNAGGLAVDNAGNLYIADTFNHRIRRVTPAGIISTVAGNGKQGYSGDNGPQSMLRWTALSVLPLKVPELC